MTLTVSLVTLVVALTVLLFCAEKLVSATEDLGISMGASPFLMGLTVLAVGTSLPELITGLFGIYQGTPELVVGTVMGSNIANILFILGFTAIFSKEININWDLLHGDIPILFGSIMLAGFLIYPVSTEDLARFGEMSADSGKQNGSRAIISLVEGIFLVSGYLVYIFYHFFRAKEENKNKDGTEEPIKHNVTWKTFFWVLVGLVGVPAGAEFTVQASVELASILSVGEEVVAASLIAFGTSLPELVVSISAMKRGNVEMALGNVTGSNIFNTFMVLGIPAIVAPFLGDKKNLPVGDDSILFLQMPYYAATGIVFLIIVLDKKLTRTEGMILLGGYLLFIAKLYSLL